MNSSSGRFVRGMGVVALAGFLARPAAALPTLIFIDDFSDPVAQNSSPAPGQPGAGEIGGTAFWYTRADSGNTGSNTISGGSLTIVSRHTATQGSNFGLLSNLNYGEFDYLSMDPGQGLLLSMRGIDFQSDNGQLLFGFMHGTGLGGTQAVTNAFLMNLWYTGEINVYARPMANFGGAVDTLITIPATGMPARIDLYVDKSHFGLGFDYGSGLVWADPVEHKLLENPTAEPADLRLWISLQPRSTSHPAIVSIDEVSVTQIPEPGSLALMGLLGVALAVRRLRRPAA